MKRAMQGRFMIDTWTGLYEKSGEYKVVRNVRYECANMICR